LDENFSRPITTFDEVHHSVDCSTNDVPWHLKRGSAEVSSGRRPHKDFSCACERPAGTSPPTFLFLPIHLSNSPEPQRSRPFVAKGPSKLCASDAIGSLVTLSVRCFERRTRPPRRRRAVVRTI
jgi:hypothetical protein